MSLSWGDVKPICFEAVEHYINLCGDLGWWSDVCKEEKVIQYLMEHVCVEPSELAVGSWREYWKVFMEMDMRRIGIDV